MNYIFEHIYTTSIRILLVLSLILFILSSPISLNAQECVGDFELTSQSEIDNFNCTSVTGTLEIIGLSLSDPITNLDALSELTSVGSNLFLIGNAALTNVDGLAALVWVGGHLAIEDNHALTNVDGLAALTSVEHGLGFYGNPSLINVDGLAALTSVGGGLLIWSNATLTNIDGLAALTSVGNALIIQSNAALTNVDGLAALTSVGFDLYFYGNPSLTNVDGLAALTSVEWDFSFYNNAALTNVDGLAALTSVGWNVNFVGNPSLTNVDGLAALTSVGWNVNFENNVSLMRCCGLYPLFTVGTIEGSINIDGNCAGCNSVDEILNAGPCVLEVHEKLLWQDQFNGSANGDDVANAIAVQGNRVFVAGSVENEVTGSDFTVRAYHARTGSLLWEDQVDGGSNGYDAANAVAVQNDRVYVGGSVFNGESDDFIVRGYNALTGNLLWEDQVDGMDNGSDIANAIALDRNGKRVFVGGVVGHGEDDIGQKNVIIKTYHAKTGKLLWEYSDYYAAAKAIAVIDKRVFTAGHAYSYWQHVWGNNIYTGNLLWDGGKSGAGIFNSIAARGDGVFTAGWNEGPGSGHFFIAHAYHAKTGNLLWWDGGESDISPTGWYASDGQANAIAVSTNGKRVFAAGYLITDSHDSENFAVRAYLAKTGNLLWEDQLFGSAFSYSNANDIAVLDYNVFVVGNVEDDFTVRVYHSIEGDLLWQDQYNGTSNGYDVANATAASIGRVFVVGKVSNLGKGADFTIRAYQAR